MNFKYISVGETGKFVNLCFENTKIMVGSLFTELDIVCLNNILINEDKTIKYNNKEIKNKYYKFENFIQDILLTEFETIFDNINYVIITNLDEILSWPFILRKLNHKLFSNNSDKEQSSFNYSKEKKASIITKNIKFIATEPITQISRTLLHDFYDYFNKIMNENILDYQYFINSIFLNEFIDSIINLNFNCEFKIDDYLQIVLGSSGYNLGSSNVLFKFYNKKIIYLSLSSFYDYRYTKPFEFFEEIKEEGKFKNLDCDNNNNAYSMKNINLLEPDVLICGENILKFEEEFISEFEKIINMINGIMQQYDRENNHFPSIFFPTDPLFILDFIDIKRLKISNDIKSIYLSKALKAILEYANVSHGFINKAYHNKIYEFKLPFNYEEMMKNDSFLYYDDFEEFTKSIQRSETETSYSFPKILMVNLYSLISNGLGSELFDYFKMNTSLFDGYFNIFQNSLELNFLTKKESNYPNDNKNIIADKRNDFKYLRYNFDLRMNIINFSDLIFNKWKPKVVYMSKSLMERKNFLNNPHMEKFEKDKINFLNWLKENFNIKKNEFKDENLYESPIKNNVNNNQSTYSIETLSSGVKLDFKIDIDIEKSIMHSGNRNESIIYESKKYNLNQVTKQIDFVSNSNIVFLKLISPEFFSKSDFGMEIDYELNSYLDKIQDFNNIEEIKFENLVLKNAYLIDKKENIYDSLKKEILTNNTNIINNNNVKTSKENNAIECKEVKVKIEKENEKFYFQPLFPKDKEDFNSKGKKNKGDEKNIKFQFNIQTFENYLKEIIFLNKMNIVDTIIKDNNSIEFKILKEKMPEDKQCTINEIKENGNISSIKIIQDKDCNYDIEIECEDIEDNYFLNYILFNN